jgi:hypothetical protein
MLIFWKYLVFKKLLCRLYIEIIEQQDIKFKYLSILFNFLTKNDIHSFKLIKYIEQYNSRLLKTEKDESANKLTVSTLIAYNDKMSTSVTKPTNMMNLKCSKYLCLRVCNVDDAKVIDCWICTESNLICQFEPNKYRTKTGQ